MFGIDESFTIVKELKDLIIPLGPEELSLLEKSILKEGCREPLTVWQKNGSQVVLVDGHNRFKICEKHKIPFKVRKVKFNSLEEAKVWMIDNQMGRRNLTPDQMSYYRGIKYLSLRKKKGGYENVKAKGQSETRTTEIVAKLFNVSDSTVKRDAKFAEGLDIVGRTNAKLKLKILTGDVKVKKSDIQALSNSKNPEKLTIKNEADLFNKAQIIKNEILTQVETDLKGLKKHKEKDLEDPKPIFLNKEDRLKRIKGMILSAINRAINAKDIKAIGELKKLIERLENELFE